MMAAPTATDASRAIRALGSPSRERVDAARARLCMMGGRALDALIEALEGAPPRIKARVMPLLALIQDPRGRAPLVAMLLDRSPRLREVAARALGRFPRTDVLAALTRLLERERVGAVREAAVQALVEQYRAGHEPALGPVLDLLAGPGRPSRPRRAAVEIVPLLTAPQRRAIAQRLAGDGDRVLRARASELVHGPEARGDGGPEEIERLLADLDSADYACWAGAVHRLAAYGAPAVVALVEAMRERAQRPEYCARAGAALKGMGRRAARPIARALETIDEPLPLQALVEVVGTAGTPALVYRLEDLLQRLARKGENGTTAGGDSYRRVRARAHLELARLGSRVAIRDLRAALDAQGGARELELLAAVELIGTRGEIALLLSAWRAEQDEFVRRRIAGAVQAIMRRERIPRNSRLFQSLDDDQAGALAAILPPKRARPSPRRPGAETRERA